MNLVNALANIGFAHAGLLSCEQTAKAVTIDFLLWTARRIRLTFSDWIHVEWNNVEFLKEPIGEGCEPGDCEGFRTVSDPAGKQALLAIYFEGDQAIAEAAAAYDYVELTSLGSDCFVLRILAAKVKVEELAR